MNTARSGICPTTPYAVSISGDDFAFDPRRAQSDPPCGDSTMSCSPPHSSASAALPKARARTAHQRRFPLGQYRPAWPGDIVLTGSTADMQSWRAPLAMLPEYGDAPESAVFAKRRARISVAGTTSSEDHYITSNDRSHRSSNHGCMGSHRSSNHGGTLAGGLGGRVDNSEPSAVQAREQLR